ncbi:MAG TPA: hypothetical protein VF711_02885 [Acidimicrobiales bacterium]|jgi:hypothetical protein
MRGGVYYEGHASPVAGSVQGGLKESGTIKGGAGSVSASLSDAVGVKTNFTNGEKTYFFKYGGSISGDAGVILGGGLEGDATLGLTMDKDGNPVKLSIEAGRTYTTGLDLAAKWENLTQMAKGLKDAKLKGKDQAGSTLVYEANLDLTKPENRAAAEALVGSLAPGGKSPGEAAGALLQRSDQDGEIMLRRYDTSVASYGIDVGAGLGLKVGLEGEYETKNQVLTCATSHQPGGGFVVVQGCGP